MEKSSQFESSYQSDVVATWDPQIIGPIAGGNKLENICSAKITNHKIRSTKSMNQVQNRLPIGWA